MKSAFARVVEARRLYGNTYVTWFAAPDLCQGARPGQFVMLRCAEGTNILEDCSDRTYLPNDPLLPRAMSIHRMRRGPSGDEWSILYDVVGRGTEWLASRHVGDAVHGWGPLGHGFTVQSASQQLLLVAGGVGVAPLVWLADDAISQNKAVTLILGGRSRDQIYPASMLPPQVEVITMTEDGSLGDQGLATTAFEEHLGWCDQAFACGPNAMFAAMAKVVKDRRSRTPVQVLLEERMGCGTGICYGCAVATRKGMLLVCKDGPRFDLRQVSY